MDFNGDSMMKFKFLVLTFLSTITSLLTSPMFSVSVLCAVRPEAYVNHTYGFSINPPNGWTVDESGTFETVVIFSGPLILETGGNINIQITAGTTNTTLDQFISADKSQLASLLANFHLVSESSRNVSGLDCYELVITWTYVPGGNVSDMHTFNVKQKQVVFIENGKGYIITFTAPPTNYDSYLPAFEESLQTFQLLGQEAPWLLIGMLIGIAIVAGAVGYAAVFHVVKGRKMKLQQQKIEGEMLDVLRLHKSIKIDDLARKLQTKEADVELAVVRLRKDGVPISFNIETREVIYESQK